MTDNMTIPETITKPRERPILYGPEMIHLLLAGQKTQTRKVFQYQPKFNEVLGYYTMTKSHNTSLTNRRIVEIHDRETNKLLERREYNRELPAWLADLSPLGQVGDTLWVRETWQRDEAYRWIYHANFPDPSVLKWRPKIHMPREACRITLRITDAWAEQVQDISPEDIEAEGIYKIPDAFGWAWRGCEQHTSPQVAFIDLWNRTNPGRLSWDANPWTSVVTFEVEVADA